MSSSFLAVLNQKKKLVWPVIEQYLNTQTSFPKFCQVPPRFKLLAHYHQQLISAYPQRLGKYLRPSLVLLSAAAFGFPEEKALQTAAAMQVSEDWILTHDDWEDHSLVRRGAPTLHRLYPPELAINAGDALHVLMWQILLDNQSVIGSSKTFAILHEFSQMLRRTTLGQTVELKWTLENKANLSDQDILFILESKTAYYTISGPLRLGAILGNATPSQLETLHRLAQPLGYCFQITDDLLDLTSDFAGLKKQTGNDIYEGKRTIMLAHLLRHIKGQNKTKLANIMKKNRHQKTKSEVRWVINAMTQYGSLDYSRQLIQKLNQQAKDIFTRNCQFLKKEPARRQLSAGIDFLITRTH